MKESYHKAFVEYKGHGQRVAHKVHRHALSTPKKIIISSIAVLLVVVIAIQFFYATDRVIPFAKVDTIAVGGLKKEEAVQRLDEAYGAVKVPVYFSSDKAVKVEPKYEDLGVRVDNTQRIANHDYPWYVRVIPTSLLWYGLVDQSGDASETRDGKHLDVYFAKYFGAECKLAPVNATLAPKGEKLEVVPAVSGGTCDYDELHPALEKVAVTLKPEDIVVKGTTELPAVNDAMAKTEKQRAEAVLNDGLALKVGDKAEQIPAAIAYSWVSYTTEDGKLEAVLDEAKADSWLTDTYGKQLAVSPGVTKVVTRDFTELSRVNGKSGQAIDTGATREALQQELRGKTDVAVAATRVVQPTVQYERSYSPTDEGLSALLKNYAESKPGTYGISLVELSGQKRRAEFNGSKQFTTASIYKLFVAYSALLRVEDGRWKWSDQINGGRNLEKCLDDMIVLSDNGCAEVMLKKIGFSDITKEARAIGATNTSFLGANGIKSTTQDQAVFMGSLYSGQLLSQQSSRDRLIGALKRNVHRKGIPAGLPGIAVADKVGFLDGLLHDSAIVYSPTGTYVLTIMTEGSSWANIADLAKQIEALRNQ